MGIDPGTNILGYAVLEVDGNALQVPAIGVIKLKSFDDHQTKLKEIYLQIQEIIETYLPKSMAVEAPFYGKNAQSMLKLGRAQGVAIAAGITMGLEITEYSPKMIKKSITGNGNASKEQVAGMLKHLVNFEVTEYYLDATDALAAAYTHFNKGSSILGENKKYSGWANFIKENPKRTS